MSATWIKAIGFTASAVVYSHAIFGIGGHWGPSPGLEVKGSNTVAYDAGGGRTFNINQGAVSGLQGFGLKLWIDMLPFIDLEAGTNIQFGEYDLALAGPTASGRDSIAVKFDFGVPLAPEKPAFARVVSDASVLYPFLKLPPVVSIIKIYAGAGITHVLASEVMNAGFAKKALEKAVADNKFNQTTGTVQDASKVVVDAIKDEGLASGIGFHLIAGARAKPPVIPIAAYANLKYHFLGSQPDAVDGNSITFELGGGLAF